MISRKKFFVSILLSGAVAAAGFFLFAFFQNRQALSDKIEIVDAQRFGKIEVHLSSWNKTGPLVLLFFDSNSCVDQDFIQGLVARGAVVARINFDTYAASVLAENDEEVAACYEYAGEIGHLSQVLQNRFQMKEIGKAILVGQGIRAAQFVYAVEPFLKEDLYGAVSIELAQLSAPRGFCQLEESAPTVLDSWRYFATAGAEIPAAMQEHAVDQTFVSCSATDCPMLEQLFPKQAKQVKASQIVEQIPKSVKKDYFVILLSGDGGWASIDKALSKEFLSNGIAVVGFNCLRYFWRKKTVDQTANSIKEIILHYQQKLHLRKVVLVGFSFGANTIPFVLSRLPEKVRNDIKYVALLNPTIKTEFEIHYTDWLPGDDYENGIEILPEFSKIAPQPMSCIVGKEEDDSLCGQQLPSWVKIISLPGSHHYDGDFEAVSVAIAKEVAVYVNR